MKEIDPGFDLETIRKEELVIFILRQLFSDIKKQQRLLVLDIEEILSTMILMVHDLNNHSAWINVSGDGIIVCDGDLTEIDQENIPDYMGYYMDETFGDWYGDHTRNLQFSGIRDISISTDGIRKLRTEDSGQDRLIDPVDYLLLQDPGDAGENFLTERYLELTRQRGYVPVDDMSIIRVIP